MNWVTQFTRIGISPTYAPEERLKEALQSAQVLILPYTLAMSDEAIRIAGSFAEDGGIVIADVFPGITDERGVPRADLAQLAGLFGVEPLGQRLPDAARSASNRAASARGGSPPSFDSITKSRNRTSRRLTTRRVISS